MKNIYLIFTFLLLLSAQNGFGQDGNTILQKTQSIEGLSVYPNPVRNSASSIFITSTSNTLKEVSIYNVLGKQVTKTVSTRKILDISSLHTGVYILKITEGAVSETRKLVIK